MSEAAQKRAEELIGLAQTQFAPLREAEEKLLRAAPAGEMAWCGPSKRDADPTNDARKSDMWGQARAIRAELIRWLCIDRDAREYVDQRGIQAHGARIEGELDLSFVTVPFPLVLTCCGLRRETTLRFLEIPTLSLSGVRGAVDQRGMRDGERKRDAEQRILRRGRSATTGSADRQQSGLRRGKISECRREGVASGPNLRARQRVSEERLCGGRRGATARSEDWRESGVQ